ncbi:ABC transporter ATP-binding protein [Microbacterium aquimaris]|uniref:ABC transporter ATP-binding protein n=1 Tax=Microbacterium aquimaris TaxID=459816 RepID=UPI002AD59E35|nr:ABC transporter ATP-binding protein [Microbacterium aquimaris]MDZ8276167.1 ABC transporter ATP-binding protein [Microbacterium aquimaris]
MTTTLEAPVSTATPSHGGAVRLDAVGRTFGTPGGSVDVLRGVDLELPAGEIVAVIGASGCGKSTLLRLVGGLDQPTHGAITVDGGSLVDTDDRAAIAFQEPRLLPWRTLAQNVELGLPRLRGRRRHARAAGRDRVRELLELVGLDHAADLRPREVSGGMAQRASLARALARNPDVLLLDEPFAALDALTRLRMQDLLLDVHAAQPTTILLVTHDVEEALYLADRVVLLTSLRTTAPGTPSIAQIIPVSGTRPRDRADRALADLRATLLEGLGVHTHHHNTPEETR